jgi:segregation and condensation protein B
METTELRAAIEAILFVSTDPVNVDDLSEAFDEEKDAVSAQLEEIKRVLDASVGGFTLEQTAGGWRLATRAEHDPILKKYFAKKGENRLSLAALETLAIVGYRQPITAPEVSEIRGVNSTAVIRTLLERRMIRVAGRKNVVGSPFLYRTTKEFLVHFGLNDIRDLPRLEEFGDLIGENINDDLVAAIAAADDTTAEATEVVEASRGELDAAALADLGEEKSEASDVASDENAAEGRGAPPNDDANDDAQWSAAAPGGETSIDANDESGDDEAIDARNVEVESGDGEQQRRE